ncbi:ATP-binding protein [Corynebacterium pseudotuberculosis]|uniref:AAA family ATPase n=1 Tax=Corynebacterium pseudotuberculosis (strain C231) TaxID=681645 RepID=D9QAI0_CORP2|nr:ATP-binding protein [Corynebacterium pseudotuberculosis]ADK28879.1 AAA family ATPase [Corynebacterium pseudotuberculosis FRC41]ADL10556.1 AAA family ATPase [Corynebacterium pseudotuberculosis C231]ADL20966.1 ATP-binding protein [Corynebacterium pseudotuberculosis 1002]ADO26355.1 AAA family ATPase [Corynebacterium pseudotuberculosis I19]AEK92417.1 Archaeal ATPase [Corynebacterium pseudotuberculosis PAT10]
MRNPFRPSFGVNPLVVAGRTSIVDNFGFALREGIGAPYRFILISGTRGTGKTVLLNQLEEEAKELGWECVRARASDHEHHELIHVSLPRLIKKSRAHGSRVEISGVSIANIGGITFDTSSQFPQQTSLWSIMNDAAKDLTAKGSGLLITMDEVQSASPESLHFLMDAIQDCVRNEYNIALAVAGLPLEISKLLAHEGTTFLRRAIHIPIEALNTDDVRTAIAETVKHGGKDIDSQALNSLTNACHGYAYLLQLCGSIAWTMSGSQNISEKHVTQSLPLVIERMGQQVHMPAMKGIPYREMQFLIKLAEAEGPANFNELGAELGIPGSQPSTYRRRLLDRGVIVATGRGRADFALPYLREHLRLNADQYL